MTNLLRPTADSWEKPWGDAPVPADVNGSVVEVGLKLESKQIGATLCRLPPGGRSGPLHYHHFEEELFYVVSGELTVRELRRGGGAYVEYTLQAGELVVYPPGTGIAHQSWNRSDEDIRYLALSSERDPHEVAVYPDAGKTQVRAIGMGVFGSDPNEQALLCAARAAADARAVERVEAAARPEWVQGRGTMHERDLGGGVFGMPLGRAGGATRVFVNHDRLTEGSTSSPLHHHTADEELLFVLDGSPVLRQRRDRAEERETLRPGDFVSWRAGDEVAHQVLAERGESTVLVVGTSHPGDVVVFPEQGQIYVAALGEKGRLVKSKEGSWAG